MSPISLILAAALAIDPFHPGERVALLGDSITHHGYYPQYLQLFLEARHPGSGIRIFNCGIGGNTAAAGRARLRADVLPREPDRILIGFGINDTAFWEVRDDAIASNALWRAELNARYRANLARLADEAKATGCRTELLLMPPFDTNSTVKAVNNPYIGGALSAMCETVRGTSREKGIGMADFHSAFAEINAGRPVPPLQYDRVHPGKVGNFLMASLLLAASGEPAEFARTRLTAGGEVLETRGASVAEVSVAKDRVEFDYGPQALPLPLCPECRAVDRLWGVTDRLNREMLIVEGLTAGNWTLAADGRDLGTFSAADFAKGVNLAVLETPNQLKVRGLAGAPLTRLWKVQHDERALVRDSRGEIPADRRQALWDEEERARAALRLEPCRFRISLTRGGTRTNEAKELFGGEFTPACGWIKSPEAEFVTEARGLRFDTRGIAGESFAKFTPKADLSSGGVMRVSFTASWQDIVMDEVFSCAGFCVLVEYVDAAGRKIHPKNVNMGFGTRERSAFELEFPVAQGAHDFWIWFGVRRARGRAALDGLSIRFGPPDAVSVAGGGAATADIVGEESSYAGAGAKDLYINRTPPPRHPRPDLRGRPLAFFRVDSPRRALSAFPPAEAQLSDTFGIAAAKGETSDLFFGVYASRDVKFTVEAPRGFPGRVSVCRAHEWLRKDAGGVTRMPEVLFPVEGPVTLPAGCSALMMLQVRVPEDAESGHYADRLRLVAGGAVQEAEVALDVLPFSLRWPSPRKHESVLHGGPLDDETPDRMIGLAKEMKARGFESMLVPCQYGRGMLVLAGGADGNLRIESFRRLDNAIAAYRAAGMTGTFFVHFSDKLEAAVSRALGVGLKDGHGEQTNMVPEMETPEFKSATVSALKAVADRCKGLPLVFLGMDEPNTPARVPRTRWEVARIREAGFPSALYCSAAAYRNTCPDFAIASSAPGSKDCLEVAADVASRGGRYFQYSYEGAYGYSFGSCHNSCGGVMPSRFTHGWGEYLTPASGGHTAWLFGTGDRVSESDASCPPGYAALTRYDGKGRLLTTLHLEGACLGMTDYAYLNTLEELLAERRESPRAKEIAAAFAALKAEVRANHYPYVLDSADAERPLFPGGELKGFTDAKAREVRVKVAGWISEIRSLP